MQRRKFLVCFTRIDDLWWHRFFNGYNHCFVLIPFGDKYLQLEPGICRLFANFIESPASLTNCEILSVKIRPIYKQSLIGIKPTTCSTMVQYICGFDIGAITVSRLHSKLTNTHTTLLNKAGILEVKRWEPSTTL